MSAQGFVYWVKWIIAYIAIRLHITFNRKRFDLYKPYVRNDPEKLGFLVPQTETDLESPRPESHLEAAADEVLFYGVNSKSEALLLRINRGSDQVAEAWIYLKLSNGKSYYLTENVNYQYPFEEKCVKFSCGNLQMYHLCPMRRWRIHYCGLLREKSENGEESDKMVFVKFIFLWTASSNVYDFTLDNYPSGFASTMAKLSWDSLFQPPIQKFSESLNFYVQVGAFRGTVSAEEGPDYEMYLFGEKMRNLGNSSNIAGCTFNSLIGYIPQNGFGFHLSKASEPFEYLPSGFIIEPGGQINVVKDTTIEVNNSDLENSKKEFKMSFTAGEPYNVVGSVFQEPVLHLNGHSSCEYFDISFINFDLNGKNGYGFIISGKALKDQENMSLPVLSRSLSVSKCQKPFPFTVKFSEEIATSSEVSGGKGSFLGKLTQMSIYDKTFVVPKGIVVTTSAYESFLTLDIIKEIKNLEKVTYGAIEGNVKTTCDIVSRVIVNSKLPDDVCQSIIKDLNCVFNENFPQKKFAVRSSATGHILDVPITGEDTDVMSAAGQMDTFLGIQDIENIFTAVKKCWASQFGHIAVEYKRQNGQILNSPMAVVIQEMVDCEVSGVLFTCNPVTNNPTMITITANFGLGETVVSGSVEPDTITLQRTVEDQLKIKSIMVGSKHEKIVVQDSGGTTIENVSECFQKELCLSEETAIRLGKIGIKVEKFYKSTRDIEWGISKGIIYLFQSRPVTSGSSATDFEIKHELDSPLRCENDHFSVANVGEVMPGAVSPLGMEIIVRSFQAILERQAHEKGFVDVFAQSKYYTSMMPNFYCHMMLSVIELISRHGHETTFSKGHMLSIFGRILDDQDIFQLAKEKIKKVPNRAPRAVISLLMDLFFHDSGIEKIKQKNDKCDLWFLRLSRAGETFDGIMKSCSEFDDSFLQHIRSTMSSSIWNAFMFVLLCRIKGGIYTEIYSDFARLLASSRNLESADVPSSMQNLAHQIVEEIGKEKFQSMSLEKLMGIFEILDMKTSNEDYDMKIFETGFNISSPILYKSAVSETIIEAESWLETSDLAGDQFRQFLKRHGHRCIKELDVYSVTWENDRKRFIQLLQTLCESVRETKTKEDNDCDRIFSELNLPLNTLNRRMLKFVVKNCWKAVRSRESSKSILIKSIDHWRRGFLHLSKLMVSEGFIPDADLLFFMRLEEIRTLLKTRFPNIITRANYRRKLFPVLEGYQFPEMMKGTPKPINEEDSSDIYEFIADLTMEGIPVSQGVVKGYARVATSLEDAALLKPGEILIAYSTDIGWSPYFPIISGVVTELGGLISHGAVVSREYGLPCVVGLQGATKMFQTGDYVLLDGRKGILQRLPLPQEE